MGSYRCNPHKLMLRLHKATDVMLGIKIMGDISKTVDDISETVDTFYDEIRNDPNHRYKSWEHCYSYFQSNKAKDIDHQASLHLGFYLASWGMLRASFLLQKNYKVHTEVVKILLDKKYIPLNTVTLEKFDNEDNINLLFDMIKEIRRSYKDNNVSDTLVSKILLGTLGCMPAYDRLLKTGVHKVFEANTIAKNQTLNKSNFANLLGWCKKNNDKLHEAQNKINSESDVKYPIMKIVDMYFFQVGKMGLG